MSEPRWTPPIDNERRTELEMLLNAAADHFDIASAVFVARFDDAVVDKIERALVAFALDGEVTIAAHLASPPKDGVSTGGVIVGAICAFCTGVLLGMAWALA